MSNLSSANSASLESLVLLGESIRVDYQDTVADKLLGKFVVLTPNENCRDTSYMIKNLEKWLSGINPTLIHINVGLHDMFLNPKSLLPRHSPETYQQNLRTIFKKLRGITDALILFFIEYTLERGMSGVKPNVW